MISVTDNAAAQIRRLLEKQYTDAKGLRVGVKAGGCSGFEYVFAWEPEPRDTDLIFDGPGGVRVNRAGCLDRCAGGPVLVVYPEAVWYSYVDQSDIDEIVDSHLIGGKVVVRLLLAPDVGH